MRASAGQLGCARHEAHHMRAFFRQKQVKFFYNCCKKFDIFKKIFYNKMGKYFFYFFKNVRVLINTDGKRLRDLTKLKKYVMI